MLSRVDAFVSVRDLRVTAPAEMGRFVPLQSFHLAVSTTEHNVGNLRGGNGIPARVATAFTNTLWCPLGPLMVGVEQEDRAAVWGGETHQGRGVCVLGVHFLHCSC